MFHFSKKSPWVTLAFVMTVPAYLAVGLFLLWHALARAAPGAELLFGSFLTIAPLLSAWGFISTSCEITPTDLIARMGPFRRRIPLEAITDIVPKKNWSSDGQEWNFGWSPDRLVIEYRKASGRMAWWGVAVSPEDAERFCHDLWQAVVDSPDVRQGFKP